MRDEIHRARGVAERAAPRPTKSRIALRLAAAVFCLAGLLVASASAETGKPASQADVQRVEGRWVRPDGGYVLELAEIKKDGSVKALYFNPRPIHVARAEIRKKGDKFTVYVELRDVNYPGSNYTLEYDPTADRLKGTYYQAVAKETYAIEFVRLQ